MAPFRVTINGIQVEAVPGTTIFQAAQLVGIEIPHLCHEPRLTPTGACRLCVVEVERARNLQASCTTPVADGMVVSTESPRVVEARKTILELILADHDVDCLTCEKSGDCKLQDYAYYYGVSKSRFEGEKRRHGIDDRNPFFIRDHDKCIICGRCVKACEEISGAEAIDYSFRGFKTKVTTAYDEPLIDSPCVFCGSCVEVCPVGALVPKQRARLGRTWETQKIKTVCPYCGVGCSINLHVKDGRIIDVTGAPGPSNNGFTCVKGRFGLDFVNSPERLKKPLIKRDGTFEEATWEEALNLVARRLVEIKDVYGPEAIGGLSSAKCTNEENYLMQKLMRAALQTNNIDHCARLCHASTVTGLSAAFGSGAMTNSIKEISSADVVLVVGSNTAEAHPVIGYEVIKAQKNGAVLIVADPREVGLANRADIYLQHLPGTDVALLNGMMNFIIEESLCDFSFIRERTEGFDELREMLKDYPPERVQNLTGVPADKIRAAARAFGKAQRGTILYAMGITQHTTGHDNVLTMANLAMLTGNVGKESSGVNPLRGQNNVQGACDMGALPDFYPGYQRVDDDTARAKFQAAWGTGLPKKRGLTVVEMMQAAVEGGIRALYIMGENPLLSDPDIGHVREGLEALDFLVVQDIFMTETARLADVVLPAGSFAEKNGTFTNTERRVQLVRQAVPLPGEAKPDWQILCLLSGKLDYPMGYASPKEVMEEISLLTPIYGGITYERIKDSGLQWPCTDRNHPGTRYLHKDRFSRGKGKFHSVRFKPPAEVPDSQYPLVLTTGRVLYHFHTATMTRRSRGLKEICDHGFVEMNPETASELGVFDGELVMVATRRGQIKVKARVVDWISKGVIFIPFHFAEAAANVLTNPALDKVAKIPELKVCAARIEKIQPN